MLLIVARPVSLQKSTVPVRMVAPVATLVAQV